MRQSMGDSIGESEGAHLIGITGEPVKDRAPPNKCTWSKRELHIGYYDTKDGPICNLLIGLWGTPAKGD